MQKKLTLGTIIDGNEEKFGVSLQKGMWFSGSKIFVEPNVVFNCAKLYPPIYFGSFTLGFQEEVGSI